jgi:DNA uptake protein ComE-like DNA-binding protein
MKLNTEPIKNWFGFTRRERRSSFILLLIMAFILGLREAVPQNNIVVEDITDTISYNSEPKDTGAVKTGSVESTEKKSAPAFRRSDSKLNQNRPLINLNKCDTSQLISLPGIGPVLSVRIIKYRNLLGGFATVDQLREVYGLSSETFDLIRGRIYADSAEIVRININEASFKELSRLPYFENYEVTAILKFRELKGRIEGVNELKENKLLPPEKAVKIRPYLNFD